MRKCESVKKYQLKWSQNVPRMLKNRLPYGKRDWGDYIADGLFKFYYHRTDSFFPSTAEGRRRISCQVMPYRHDFKLN